MKTLINNIFIVTLIFGSFTSVSAKKKVKPEVQTSLNTGYDIKVGEDYSGKNFHIGAQITNRFESNPRVYWKVGVDLNWNKFRMYNYESNVVNLLPFDGNYAVLKTNSFSVPIEFGYEIKKSLFYRTYLFAGPVYDYIFNASLNGGEFDNFDQSAWGVRFGAKARIIRLVDLSLLYNYFPDYSFYDTDFNRSTFNLSIGYKF